MAAIPPRTNIYGIKKAAIDGIDGAFERGKKYGRYLALQEYLQQKEESKPKWISAEERLPDVGEKVMICGVKNGMQVGAFRGLSHPGENRKWWWKKNTVIEVTHWMPLPEPPKEDA